MPSQPEWLQIRAKELRSRMTRPEKLLWRQLKTSRNCGVVFRRQEPMLGKYVVDFVSFSARLIVEIDGFTSHLDRGAEDEIRQLELESIGFRVMRLRAKDVLDDPIECAIRVLAVAEERHSGLSDTSEVSPLPNPPRQGEGKS